MLIALAPACQLSGCAAIAGGRSILRARWLLENRLRYEMVLGVHRALDIVANDPAAPAAVAIERASGVCQGDLLVLGLQHLGFERIQALYLY
jgi:hypothetical protein